MLHMQHFTSAHPEAVTDYGAGTPLPTAVYPVLAAQHLAGSSDSRSSSVAGLFRSGLPGAQLQPPCLHTVAKQEEFTKAASELGALPRHVESCLPVFTAVAPPLTAPSLAVQYHHKEHAASQELAILTASGTSCFAAAGPRSHQSFGHQPLHWSAASEAAEEDVLLKELGSPEEVPLLEGLGHVAEEQGCQGMPDRSQLLSLFDDAFPMLAARSPVSSVGRGLSPLPDGSESYDSAGSAGTKAGRSGGRRRKVELSEASTDYGSVGLHEPSPGSKRQRPGSSESITDAQRARCRETARRLRQKKAEALQQLQQDVNDLAKENQNLIGRLRSSVALLDKVNHQNSGLRTILQCLKPAAGNTSQQMSAALTELARLERVSPCLSGEGRPNLADATDLAALALVRSSGRPGAAVEQLVQLAVSQPVVRARRKQ